MSEEASDLEIMRRRCGKLFPHTWRLVGADHYCLVCNERSGLPAWPDGQAGMVARYVQCPDCSDYAMRQNYNLDCPNKDCGGVFVLPLNPRARVVVKKMDGSIVYQSEWLDRAQYLCSVEHGDDTALLATEISIA